jgi:hypothetical protein
MTKPQGSPPKWVSVFPVAGLFQTSSELCSAWTMVIFTLFGPKGMMLPPWVMRFESS